MFKEILHYTFKQPGAAFDISGFHHHGRTFSVDHSVDGAESGSGALLFDGSTSRVHVPFSKAWQGLGAIKVEALVRIDAEAGRTSPLVDGDLSFTLLSAERVVLGFVLLPTEPERRVPDEDEDRPPPDSHSIFSSFRANPSDPDEPDEPDVEFRWFEVSSLARHAPDGVARRLEPGVWTRVTLIHNGFSLQLWFDDELVGYRDDVSSGVPGVRAGGVSIGSFGSPSAKRGGAFDPRLRGALDEVRIWKLDPLSLNKQFLCRPVDARTELCWQALLGHLSRQLSDPEAGPSVREALRCISDTLDDLSRAIHRQGGDAIRRLEAFRRRYHRLWCEGRIDGAEMATLCTEFGEWLDRTAAASFAAALTKLLACREAIYRSAEGHDLTCIGELDTAWSAYGVLIGKHALKGYCSPPFAPDPTQPDKRYPTKPDEPGPTKPDKPYPPKRGC